MPQAIAITAESSRCLRHYALLLVAFINIVYYYDAGHYTIDYIQILWPQ